MERDAKRLHRALGERIRQLRKAERGLSQERLAARAGLHRTYLGKLERGEGATTVDSVAAICHALGVSLADFFEPLDEAFGVRGPRRNRG